MEAHDRFSFLKTKSEQRKKPNNSQKTLLMKCFKVDQPYPFENETNKNETKTKKTKKFVYHKYLEHQIPNCFVSGPLVCILHVVLVWTLHGVLVCRLHGVLVWTLHGVLVLMLQGVLCAYCNVLMCSLLGVLVWTLHDPLVWKLHGVHTAQYAGVNVA